MIDLWGETIVEEHITKEKKLSIFDAVKAISNNVDLRTIDPSLDLYDPYVINSALGQNLESVLYAGELNKLSNLPKHLQHLTYLVMMPEICSYAKWAKKTKNKQNEYLLKFFSDKTIKELNYVLTEEEINAIIKTHKRTQKIKGK